MANTNPKNKPKSNRPEPPEWWEEDAVREEIREELTKELEPKIKTEVINRVEKETRAKIWKELETEFKSRIPSTAQKAAAKGVLTDLETNCLARAQTCSEYADKAEVARRTSSLIYGWIGVLASIVVGPIGIYTGVTKGPFLFFVTMVPTILVLVLSLVIRDTINSRAKEKVDALRLGASKYETLAHSAKIYNDTSVSTSHSCADLTTQVKSLYDDKSRLDQVNNSGQSLSLKDVRRVRVDVTEQQITDFNLDDLTRVDTDENGAGELNNTPSAI